ncbi:MAG: alpha/beta hydrolase [Flavobacteriaceae bacterium]|nr:alpha/beta hydrolase [Flavobacteriaceae bacterium]
MSAIYKNKQAKIDLMNLYDQKLQSLQIAYKNIDVNTKFGNTRVVQAGNNNGKKIVLFHGYNAGAPLTLEAVIGLMDTYCFYAIETVGQATKSDETTINIKDDSFALWADEVLDGLQISSANFIGISYGAFILQKLITYKPYKVASCIFVVPSGIVSGNIWESITKLTLPFMRYKITKSDTHLRSFIKAFVPEDDTFMMKMLTLIMKGVKLDTRIPKLLKKKDISHFNSPVYIIAAKNDVYFPGEKIKKRSTELFNNIQEVHLLNDSKHMPSKETFKYIQRKIKEWIQ